MHTGPVGLFGGIVESYILGGPGWRWGCRLEGLHMERTLEQGLEGRVRVFQTVKEQQTL